MNNQELIEKYKGSFKYRCGERHRLVKFGADTKECETKIDMLLDFLMDLGVSEDELIAIDDEQYKRVNNK